MAQTDIVFSGSIPQLYDHHAGALLFAPYAADVAQRLSGLASGHLLETAAGTGIVTHALAAALPEALDFLKRYQEKAAESGVDPLGYYLPPFAYADMQVLQAAVEGTKSLDQEKLADYLRSHSFRTVAGDIRFGPDGEWTEARVIEVSSRT